MNYDIASLKITVNVHEVSADLYSALS